MTECNQETFAFTAHFSRRVEAGFSAGQVSTDGGALLLREVDREIDLLCRLAGCFTDSRSPLLVKHQLSEILAQRIYRQHRNLGRPAATPDEFSRPSYGGRWARGSRCSADVVLHRAAAARRTQID